MEYFKLSEAEKKIIFFIKLIFALLVIRFLYSLFTNEGCTNTEYYYQNIDNKDIYVTKLLTKGKGLIIQGKDINGNYTEWYDDAVVIVGQKDKINIGDRIMKNKGEAIVKIIKIDTVLYIDCRCMNR